MGKQWKLCQTLFSWAPKSLQMVTIYHEIKRCLLLGREAMTNLDSILKSRGITLLTKICILQSYNFCSSHVQMWELDRKEGWAPKNGCFWTVALEKTLESPFDSKEIKPVNPKGNQSWIFIRRTDAKAEAVILWPPVAKSWLVGTDPHAGKKWRQKRAAEGWDGVGWHPWLDSHEFEQTVGGSEGQGRLVCCSPQGRKASDTPERLNSNIAFLFLMCIFAFVNVVEWGVCMQIFFHFIISFFFFLLLNFKILHISWLVELYYIYVLQIFEIIISISV